MIQPLFFFLSYCLWGEDCNKNETPCWSESYRTISTRSCFWSFFQVLTELSSCAGGLHPSGSCTVFCCVFIFPCSSFSLLFPPFPLQLCFSSGSLPHPALLKPQRCHAGCRYLIAVFSCVLDICPLLCVARHNTRALVLKAGPACWLACLHRAWEDGAFSW